MGVPYAEVIGDPIAHSKSPLIHKFWLETLGIEGRYGAARVAYDQLAAYFAARHADPDWRGCNVASPHKQAVIPFLGEVDPVAARVGAVNAVVRKGTRPEDGLVGHNTDVAGFLEPLVPLPANLSHHCPLALQIGAGGAGRAVACALAGLGFETLVINRHPERARELTAECGGAWWDDLSIYDLASNRILQLTDDSNFEPGVLLVVNTSNAGMTGFPPLEVTLEAVSSHAIVYDIVYEPIETALLTEARKRGMRTIDGLSMLIGQAAKAFELFFGAPAPREHDADLRALLTQ